MSDDMWTVDSSWSGGVVSPIFEVTLADDVTDGADPVDLQSVSPSSTDPGGLGSGSSDLYQIDEFEFSSSEVRLASEESGTLPEVQSAPLPQVDAALTPDDSGSSTPDTGNGSQLFDQATSYIVGDAKAAPVGTTSFARPPPWWSLEEVVIEVSGVERAFLIHTPPDYDPSKNYSAVFMFHGSGSAAEVISIKTRLGEAADANDFLAIFPQASGSIWDYGLDAVIAEGTIDDLSYTKAIQAELEANWGLDEGRSFAAGMSAGGLFAQYLALEDHDLFGAYMSVAATLPERKLGFLAPEAAVPMMLIHGTEDDVVPYDGVSGTDPSSPGYTNTTISADETAQFWADQAGEDLGAFTAMPDLYDDGTTVSLRTTESGMVQQYMIEGGGHSWPGTRDFGQTELGNISQEINATDILVDFFSDYGL